MKQSTIDMVLAFILGVVVTLFVVNGIRISEDSKEPNKEDLGMNMDNAYRMACSQNMYEFMVSIGRDQLVYDSRLGRTDTAFSNKMRLYSNAHWSKSPEKYVLSDEERKGLLKDIKETHDRYLNSIRYIYCYTAQDSLSVQDTSRVTTKLYNLWTK